MWAGHGAVCLPVVLWGHGRRAGHGAQGLGHGASSAIVELELFDAQAVVFVGGRGTSAGARLARRRAVNLLCNFRACTPDNCAHDCLWLGRADELVLRIVEECI